MRDRSFANDRAYSNDRNFADERTNAGSRAFVGDRDFRDDNGSFAEQREREYRGQMNGSSGVEREREVMGQRRMEDWRVDRREGGYQDDRREEPPVYEEAGRARIDRQ